MHRWAIDLIRGVGGLAMPHSLISASLARSGITAPQVSLITMSDEPLSPLEPRERGLFFVILPVGSEYLAGTWINQVDVLAGDALYRQKDVALRRHSRKPTGHGPNALLRIWAVKQEGGWHHELPDGTTEGH